MRTQCEHEEVALNGWGNSSNYCCLRSTHTPLITLQSKAHRLLLPPPVSSPLSQLSSTCIHPQVKAQPKCAAWWQTQISVLIILQTEPHHLYQGLGLLSACAWHTKTPRNYYWPRLMFLNPRRCTKEIYIHKYHLSIFSCLLEERTIKTNCWQQRIIYSKNQRWFLGGAKQICLCTIPLLG